MEVETNNMIPLLDFLLHLKGPTLITKVYRKPNDTGSYHSYCSNYPPHVKVGVIDTLRNRATIIYQEKQDQRA
jgi:hypothetical protein